MAIDIRIDPLLARYRTDGEERVSVEGRTIAECLAHLLERFPLLKLYDEDGKLFPYYRICVNERIVGPKELDEPVRDSDEISIITSISGG